MDDNAKLCNLWLYFGPQPARKNIQQSVYLEWDKLIVTWNEPIDPMGYGPLFGIISCSDSKPVYCVHIWEESNSVILKDPVV